jgi:cytochrome oxidase Cu insertion factor (SCO1/SenC/PrrC family)
MNEPSDLSRGPTSAYHDVATSSGSSLPFVLAFALIVSMAYGGWKWWQVQRFEATRSQAIVEDLVGPPIQDFELTERSGEAFRSADMRGRVWVATYFFTTCPGNCIRLNRNIQSMHRLPELEDVTWVSITCDPDTDQLEQLRRYADQWNADPNRWLFCRADLKYTRRVAKGMNLFLSRKGHQDYAVVFDKTGKIRGMYDATSNRECEKLRTKLLELLEEDAPQNLAAKATAMTH